MKKDQIKNYLSTMKDFCVKNGYEYYIEDEWFHVVTTNDHFKMKLKDITKNSKDIYLYHENEGEGWHQQGKHPWSIRAMEKHIWEHDGLLSVHRGRYKVIVPKREGGVRYGNEWYDNAWRPVAR